MAMGDRMIRMLDARKVQREGKREERKASRKVVDHDPRTPKPAGWDDRESKKAERGDPRVLDDDARAAALAELFEDDEGILQDGMDTDKRLTFLGYDTDGDTRTITRRKMMRGGETEFDSLKNADPLSDPDPDPGFGTDSAPERESTTFDFAKPSAWEGAGGYSYSYTPGPEGRMGTVRFKQGDRQGIATGKALQAILDERNSLLRGEEWQGWKEAIPKNPGTDVGRPAGGIRDIEEAAVEEAMAQNQGAGAFEGMEEEEVDLLEPYQSEQEPYYDTPEQEPSDAEEEQAQGIQSREVVEEPTGETSQKEFNAWWLQATPQEREAYVNDAPENEKPRRRVQAGSAARWNAPSAASRAASAAGGAAEAVLDLLNSHDWEQKGRGPGPSR